jgi:uncharacterized protein
MLVRLRSIPQEGLDVSFTLRPEELRAKMPEADEVAGAFDRDVACDFHLELQKKDVQLTGRAATEIRPVCARCGEPFRAPLTAEIDLTCTPGTYAFGADSYQESDEGIVYYRHDEIDLSEIAREQVLLALPMRHLCKEECLGLCPVCGANLNLGEHACKKAAHN